MSLSQAVTIIGWDGLIVFYKHLDTSSHTWQAQHKTFAGWDSTLITNRLLVALIDEIRAVEYLYASAHSKKGSNVRKPKPFPSPWAKPDKGEKHFGKGAIPRKDFMAWYYSTD